MELSLFEIDHGKVKDYVIAHDQLKALKMVNEYFSSFVNEPVTMTASSIVSRVDDDMLTMTDTGLKSVRQIVSEYDKPHLLEVG